MTNLTKSIVVLALSGLSFASFAAREIYSRPAEQRAIGLVSASTTGSLTDLQNRLAAKADAAHASSYRIIAAGGHNTLRGSAELYQ
ncbi:multiple stress resistance protein BhsA [Martelella alba]|uniref:DUF1471 domain-containing protein n=1 Tax=Martelella alba TaxID=2590451 RepID=A0ABY2SIX4_9HYPH|nr:YdgH/BhsA/McbA-like domain containing protein [Martelella alba]TKI05384.1 DUF1471 domain-containing protein [Martelella alba]